MAKLDYKYLHTVEAKGRTYNYYRRNKQSIPLPNDPFTLTFAEAYQKVHESFATGTNEIIQRKGTIGALVTEFFEISNFKSLSAASQRDYRHHLNAIADKFGKYPIASLSRKVVLKYRAALAGKPATANYRMSVLRRLLAFGIDMGYIASNPASKPDKFAVGTHAAWSTEQLKLFQDCEDIGLLAGFYLALFTGQRQADIVKFPWANIKMGKIRVIQQKTGKPLLIPMHTQLKAFLEALRKLQDKKIEALRSKQAQRKANGREAKIISNATTVLMRPDGLPYLQDHFKHAFKEAMNDLGIKGVVFHGLRKNATHFLLQAGCTEHEVSSITGMSPQMVRHYAKGIDQELLAEKAMEKLEKSFKL